MRKKRKEMKKENEKSRNSQIEKKMEKLNEFDCIIVFNVMRCAPTMMEHEEKFLEQNRQFIIIIIIIDFSDIFLLLHLWHCLHTE